VLAVADTAMERALRVISVERGYDPIDFAVVGFGGAGALHVAELARRLGSPKAIIPPDPGLLSAYGMLASPLSKETSRTVLARSDEADAPARVRSIFRELEAEGRAAMLAEGTDPDDLVAERSIDARYVGQSFELGVAEADWVERFHETHRERYGYERRQTPVEAVTLRVTVSAPAASMEHRALEPATGPAPTAPIDVAVGDTRHAASLVLREDLRAGHHVDGPAIIQEYSGTTWIPRGCRADVDGWGCIHLTYPA